MTSVSIVGAGYTGMELAAWLLGHPRARLTAVVSRTHAGKPLGAAFPALRGLTDLAFTRELPDSDVVFLALRHGEARALAAGLGDRRVIDLTNDHRLDPAWVYGSPELHRDRIAAARRVANPGCFATATILALAPLAAAGKLGHAAVFGLTGSSGAGAEPGAGTHHPLRAANVRAYRLFTHQHVAEIRQALGGAPLTFVPASGPFVRGIHAVCETALPDGLTAADVRDLYARFYAGARFVRLCDEPPEVAAVRGSNFCDLHVAEGGGRLVVLSVIDNLVKGASGQAIQNMNLMMGWPEDEGLLRPGGYVG